ncbi:hypothetical protein [Giesbergeria anulus]|uniref:Uncharacterized protein n=1 Tax=Giesbergeria anulus TaxID=180197 RepID=A0A1H9FQD2_9BURK|nr:hypothetical protein [Giesbergeria anulus]SEQ40104.1 hypothetical protein SAMN02982919_00614 [Giesbergeria anulus]
MQIRPFLQGWPQIGLACALVLLHGHSVAQTDERATLRQERAQLDAALRLAETACQQRFAVEDCLRAERRKVRQAKDVLRARENQLNLQERRERAAQRLQSIEARQREHLPTGEAKAPKKPTPRSGAGLEKRRTDPRLAVIRAEQRQARQQEAAQQATQAQQQQRERLAAAQAHKQQVLREQAERAQKGQPTAAPLPVPQ